MVIVCLFYQTDRVPWVFKGFLLSYAPEVPLATSRASRSCDGESTHIVFYSDYHTPAWAWSARSLTCFASSLDSDNIRANWSDLCLRDARKAQSGKLPATIPVVALPAPSSLPFLSALPSLRRSLLFAFGVTLSIRRLCICGRHRKVVPAATSARVHVNDETMLENHVLGECIGHMVARMDMTSISLSFWLELTHCWDILHNTSTTQSTPLSSAPGLSLVSRLSRRTSHLWCRSIAHVCPVSVSMLLKPFPSRLDRCRLGTSMRVNVM
ncbi:hypothetical protein C8F01DRAFT_53358 [Mycena amicta]|nr:hypothetical protein C8F01DRAFT_53358 [Mycena amicta]